MFNCKDYLDECKAECCGIIPFEESFFDENRKNIQMEIIEEHLCLAGVPNDFEKKKYVFAITENLDCCFKTKENTCAIYEKRPDICRIFGNESMKCLSCPHQNKNGVKRSATQKRTVIKDLKKTTNSLINFLDKFRPPEK